MSRITIVVDVESSPLEQITKQLFKLIEVVKISELDPRRCVERELLLATVRAAARRRAARSSRSSTSSTPRSLAVGMEAITVSLEGHPDKLDDFEELLGSYGIVELQRTGRVALPKLDRQARLPSPTERKGADMAANVYYAARRRPLAHPAEDGGDHRLRLAGPRPRPEPEGLGRRAWCVGLREGSSSKRQGRGAGARGAVDRRRRRAGRRGDDPRPRHRAEGDLRRAHRAGT